MYITRVLTCVLFTLLCEKVCGDEEVRPVVEAPGGTYRGHILDTRNGRKVRAFQGIPYAKPPLGKLRFREPVKMEKLVGVYEANDESRVCFQPTPDLSQVTNLTTFFGSEDCLYLNVYVPEMVKEEGKLLPVFLWIHGGGFYVGSGSTDWNGPEYLLDRDVILVAMNYRLGILGFLSRGDSVLPGNLGMKDQVMAMRWVQDNIRSFGGDPVSVTLGGVSAGAGSVSLHFHSPLSRGLFHRGIAQSGSIGCNWSLKSRDHVRKHAKKIASYLGCSFVPEDFIKCLQKMPAEELFEAAASLMKKAVIPIVFKPVIEADSPTAFMTEESMREESDLPLIAGVTNEEAVNFYEYFPSLDAKYKDLSNVFSDRYLLLSMLGSYDDHPKVQQLTDAMVQFYTDSLVYSEHNFHKIIHLISDLMFNHGLHKTTRKHKGASYVYKFSYKGERSTVPFDIRPEQHKDSISHADDCIYLFDFILAPKVKEMNKEDLAMSNQMLDLWYNFIKSGDPTPDTKVWEESERGHKYLDITNQGLIMKSDMFKSRMDFLDQLDTDTLTLRPHEEL